MKLYELPRDTYFKLAEDLLVDGVPAKDVVIRLHNLDGAYSYCTLADGRVVHISASAEVERVDL